MLGRILIWLRRAFQLLLYFMGDVPCHVAFVMDGNRRYAERQHVDKETGHTHGYGKMVEVIHWCIELGVRHITVYAFSIDNFKRSPEEVSALMKLAEEKYKELARDNGLAEREGIKMHVVGDLELPPPAVQGAAARLMRGTAELRSQRSTLNVCFSYTASEETVNAVDELQTAVRNHVLQPEDVTAEALHGTLRTRADTPPVDLLIRTSGETRLSDFLLWQAAHAHLCYLPTLWPDMSYLDFARCVLSYQRHAGTLARLRRAADARLAKFKAAAPQAEEEPTTDGTGQPAESEAEAETTGLAPGCAGQEPAPETTEVPGTRRRTPPRPKASPRRTGRAESGDGAAALQRPLCGATTATAGDLAVGTKAGARAGGPSSGDTPGPCSGRVGLQARDGEGFLLNGTGSGKRSDSGEPSASGRSRDQTVMAGWLGWRWLRLLGPWLVGRAGSSATGKGALPGGQRPRPAGWRGIRYARAGGGAVPGQTMSESGTSMSGGAGGGGTRMGREVRLLRFFESLEQARLAWIASHADL